jgi:hypothetical protein
MTCRYPFTPFPNEEIAHHSPDGARTRVVRGGGLMSNEMSKINCRKSWRLGWPEVLKHGNNGIRLVVDAV